MLGMDFGGTKIALAVCDLEGNCLHGQKLSTGADEGGRAVLTRGISAAESLLALLDHGTHLAAVGVSTIGIPHEDRVELAPAIPGWENIALGRSVEAAFGVPVRVATDVKAAATAEARWGSLAGYDPAIYLNLGTGLAAAIVASGRVLSGAHGASGEIGYNLVDPSDVGVELSARPTLEDAVSGMGLAASGSRLLGRAVTAGQVFDGRAIGPQTRRPCQCPYTKTELPSDKPRNRRRPGPCGRRRRYGQILGAPARPPGAGPQGRGALPPRPGNGGLPLRRSAGGRLGPGG